MNEILERYIKEEELLKREQSKIDKLMNINYKNLCEAKREEVNIMNRALYHNIDKIKKRVEFHELQFGGFKYDIYRNKDMKIYVADGMYKYIVYVSEDAIVSYKSDGCNDGVWTEKMRSFKEDFSFDYEDYFSEERGYQNDKLRFGEVLND